MHGRFPTCGLPHVLLGRSAPNLRQMRPLRQCTVRVLPGGYIASKKAGTGRNQLFDIFPRLHRRSPFGPARSEQCVAARQYRL